MGFLLVLILGGPAAVLAGGFGAGGTALAVEARAEGLTGARWAAFAGETGAGLAASTEPPRRLKFVPEPHADWSTAAAVPAIIHPPQPPRESRRADVRSPARGSSHPLRC